MDKKTILTIVIVVILAIAISAFAFGKDKAASEELNIDYGDRPVKEFIIESYSDMSDGKMLPKFSLDKMEVKEGDLVRIKVTVTSGMHDFKIDEYGVYLDTKELNKEYEVEFIADKVGEFVYYCAMPGHRQMGQWGTLVVTN